MALYYQAYSICAFSWLFRRYALVSHFMGRTRDVEALRLENRVARDKHLYGAQAALPWPFNVSRDQAHRPGPLRR